MIRAVVDDLAAPYVLHVIIQDAQTLTTRDTVRRALDSAWQQAAEWGLASVAALGRFRPAS